MEDYKPKLNGDTSRVFRGEGEGEGGEGGYNGKLYIDTLPGAGNTPVLSLGFHSRFSVTPPSLGYTTALACCSSNNLVLWFYTKVSEFT